MNWTCITWESEEYILWNVYSLRRVEALYSICSLDSLAFCRSLPPKFTRSKKKHTHHWEVLSSHHVTDVIMVQLWGELGKVRWRTEPWMKQLLAILLGSGWLILISSLFTYTTRSNKTYWRKESSFIFRALGKTLKNKYQSIPLPGSITNSAVFMNWKRQCIICMTMILFNDSGKKSAVRKSDA